MNGWYAHILKERDAVTWTGLWLLANLTITFYNKHVLSTINIPPLLNTFSHMLFTFIGCFIVQRGQFPKLNKREIFIMVVYSFVFALNIVWFQFSVKLTTLSLNQVCRAITPVFQALLSYLIANKIHSKYNLLPLIPVCMGVALTSTAELNLTTLALIISLSSTVICAIKSVLSMKLLQQDLKEKMQEFSFLMIVAPLALVWVIIFNVLKHFVDMMNADYVTQFGEHIGDASIVVNNFFKSENAHGTNSTGRSLLAMPSVMNDDVQNIKEFWVYLFFGGCLAFMVNVASIGTVKRTSATTMGVMANTKQAMTIAGSMIFTEPEWTLNKLLGVVICLAGAAWYTYRKDVTRKLQKELPK